MKQLSKNLALAALLLVLVRTASAVPAYPRPIKTTQPDGTTLTVMLKGDEFHKYCVTEDGLLIAKDSNGFFRYATTDTDGRVQLTGVKANDAAMRDATERRFVQQLTVTQPTEVVLRQMRARRAKAQVKAAVKPTAKFPKEGSPRSLVILVHFSDRNFVVSDPQVAFSNMLNEQGYSANGGTGSARDYFNDNSMGTFTPQFDVVGPYTLPQTYKFYGENSLEGNDVNPVQMIVDACKLADDNGVDFTVYDTDSDGKLDNVFVFYAGYNEAESAHDDTVWPHRWGVYPKSMYPGAFNYSGTVASVTFDGKRVEDYACTSELKGRTGSTMAGIGTFCHEFGHVLGLADMYPTNDSEHFTLSDWCIMDAGAYLNEGRTPPLYNAFERFQLGFLTPELLTGEKESNVLPSLLSGNKAYLISQNDAYTLSGTNPKETEFFLFENRQKTGWDTFLPGHGLLIYRINYNKAAWDENTPNNDPLAQGVELLTADGLASEATLSGDPFPGTGNVTQFDLKSRTGVALDKRVRAIAETNGEITFAIRKPLRAPVVPTNTSTVSIDEQGFTATWDAVEEADSYCLHVYTKTETGEKQIVLAENFDRFANGEPNAQASGNDISTQLDSYTQTAGWAGKSVFEAGGSAKMGTSSKLGYLTTPALDLSADGGKFTLKFTATAWSGDSQWLKIYINNTLQHTITNLSNNTSYTFKPYSLSFTGGTASVKIKFEGNQASKGRFFLDDLEVSQQSAAIQTPVTGSPFTITGTSHAVTGLEGEKAYFYTVTAQRGEELSSPSAEVGPFSLGSSGLPSGQELLQKHVWCVGNTMLFYAATANESVEVLTVTGQRLISAKTVKGLNRIVVPATSAAVVIVRIGNMVEKVILQ